METPITVKETIQHIQDNYCSHCTRPPKCEMTQTFMSGKYVVSQSDLAFFYTEEEGCKYQECDPS